MAIDIRATLNIHFLRPPGSETEVKLPQFADDTTLLLTDDQSIDEAFHTFKLYERASGARINQISMKKLARKSGKNLIKKPARLELKSLGENFQRRKYARFTNKEAEYQGTIPKHSTAKTESNPRVKMRTKILTRRSQRPKRGMDEENISESQETSPMFNDLGQIEAWISFAAHVRRQDPGFSPSCTQTLRTCGFTSVKEFYKSEVQSNVTFNPLFEDDNSDDDKRRRHARHRLHTIDEESEAYGSGSRLH
ncbi:uncharacterized protein [Montipora capricornis]|uniref:uncharacterized protein n=1 Tax=Montipora capricornis TaxID=246305 RepID=UPI0035F0FFC2